MIKIKIFLSYKAKFLVQLEFGRIFVNSPSSYQLSSLSLLSVITFILISYQTFKNGEEYGFMLSSHPYFSCLSYSCSHFLSSF